MPTPLYRPLGLSAEDWKHLKARTNARVTNSQLRAKLREINPDEPSGEWSIFALSRALNIPFEDAESAIRAIQPQARYVGGTSVYLYSLPREETN